MRKEYLPRQQRRGFLFSSEQDLYSSTQQILSDNTPEIDQLEILSPKIGETVGTDGFVDVEFRIPEKVPKYCNTAHLVMRCNDDAADPRFHLRSSHCRQMSVDRESEVHHVFGAQPICCARLTAQVATLFSCFRMGAPLVADSRKGRVKGWIFAAGTGAK